MKRRLALFVILFFLFSPAVTGSEQQALHRQVRFFHSNDVHGETEPCG